MKLVYEHYTTDGCTYGNTVVIPFEYSSKDDFVLEVLRRVEAAKEKAKHDDTKCVLVEFLGWSFILDNDLREEEIESRVNTIEKWFELNQCVVV